MPLNPVARAAIEELRGKGVSDLTPDEIVRLNDLGLAQVQSADADGNVSLTAPVRVGNIVLHPATCASADFIDRWIARKDVGQRLLFWLVPFALAHGRECGAFDGLTDARTVCDAVKRWKRGVTATEEEIDAACSRVLGFDPFVNGEDVRGAILRVCDYFRPFDEALAVSVRARFAECEAAAERARNEADGDRAGERKEHFDDYARWKKLATELAVLTGVSPDYWYHEDRRLALFAFKRAQEVVVARAAMLGSGGSETSRVPTETIRAIAELRKAIAEIIALREQRGQKDGE